MYPFFKRFFDALFAAFFAVTLFLPFCAAAAVIKIDSPGPVIFRQKRFGQNKRLFYIYKFRTMRTDTPPDCPTHLLTDAASRVTRVGAFLRRFSLDELPQIINILKGDMSFVGPRPALHNQDDLMALRGLGGACAARPGLTGLAQVMGRDELPLETKAAYDNIYCENINFFSDVKILFLTLIKAATGSGISK